MGFTREAEAYINFIFERIAEWNQRQLTDDGNLDGADNEKTIKHLPLMFSIDGHTDLPEKELKHLGGYLDSTPVRIGNAATDHVQLDIYGELMDAIYLVSLSINFYRMCHYSGNPTRATLRRSSVTQRWRFPRTTGVPPNIVF